jgi:hypothetical protein
MDSNSNEPVKNNDNFNAPPPPPHISEDGQSQGTPVSSSSEAPKKSKKSIAIKISLGLLSIVLILAGYVGFQMYKKMKQMKEVFNYVEEMANYAAPADLPVPKRKRISSGKSGPRTSRLFGSGGKVSPGNNSGMPMFSMNVDDSKAFIEKARKLDQKKILKAMNKYSERPIVKEFLSDLKKEPEFQKALKASGEHNPMAVMENIHKIKNMKKIMGKYAMRPGFMKLMLDVMQDPEMQPFFKMMPGGMPSLSPSDLKNMETEMKNNPAGKK